MVVFNPAQLDAYVVGQPLKSRQQITITTRRIDLFKTGLGFSYAVPPTQSGAQKEASAARTAFSDQCEQVSRRRRKLQLAIDPSVPTAPTTAPSAAASACRPTKA